MSLLQRLKRLDDALFSRAGRHRIEQDPTDWERWVVAHRWQAALLAGTVTGLFMSAAWTLPEVEPQLNNFVIRALLVGGIVFGWSAIGASALAASVRVRDRLHFLEESQRAERGPSAQP